MEEINDLFLTENEATNEKLSILRAIGVGGAGGNVVNYMHDAGIKDVTLIVCNTDRQALDASPVSIKLQLGRDYTKGLGAGNNPEAGEQSAIESLNDIKALLEGAHMVFITAGMGGGTGTGAAPVIAKAAKDMGILTIGVVSIPYRSEGKPRIRAAIQGIRKMQECVDSLLIVNSQRLVDLYGDMPLRKSLHKVDEVLAMATRGIADIISKYAVINLDLADVRTAMTDSGTALMGMGLASGDDRAKKALDEALQAPLLNSNSVRDARHVLVKACTSEENELLQSEQDYILNTINKLCNNGNEANVMWGFGIDNELGENLNLTIVATGFPKDAAFDPEMRDSETVRIDSFGRIETNDDEMSNRVKLSPHNSENDREIDSLYATPEKVEMRQTSQLADPRPLSLESLAEPETLHRIEDIPAYERRSNQN